MGPHLVDSLVVISSNDLGIYKVISYVYGLAFESNVSMDEFAKKFIQVGNTSRVC